MSRPLLSETAPTAPMPPIGALRLFLLFSRITLSGFGGMPFWTRRALVERQHWLTERESLNL
jgi:chromate transport protein ChrA